MDIHRLEAVVDAEAVRPPRDRCAFVPRDDRRPVPAHRLEVAAVLRVVRVLIQPVEGVAGDLERPLVAGHVADRAGGVDHERDAIGVLLVAEPGGDPALRVEHPVEAAELPVPHDLVQERDPVPRIAQELVAMGRRVPGERRRRPGHPRLVHQERVIVRPRRPVPRERLVEPATLPVHRPRIPVAGQLHAQELVDPGPECRRILPGNRRLDYARAHDEIDQCRCNNLNQRCPEHADDLPGGRGPRDARRVVDPNALVDADDVTGSAMVAQGAAQR